MANIRNNTTTIQSILATVKNLPEAGSGGVTPTGTIEIKANDEYDVTNYAMANVQVPMPASEDLGEITPSKESQTFDSATTGKLYSKVVIKAVDDSVIKSIYGDNVVNTAVTDGTNAAAEHILSGKKAYVNGKEVEGNIVTNDSDDLKIDETDKSKVIVPEGYYNQNYSKSVGTGTLGKPSINSTTGKVSSTVATAGYLATSASTPANNVLQLTTMAGNKSTPITPSTTSQKVVSAGTYTTGDIYVGAIPNQQVGGTYTLNPGESVSRASGTYLTSDLNVTAAAASGESGNSIYGTFTLTADSRSIDLDFVLKTWDGKNAPTLPKRVLLMKATNITSGVIAAYYQRDSGSAYCMGNFLIYGQSQVVGEDSYSISWHEIGVNTLCPGVSAPTDYLFTSGYYYAIVQFE